jgi:hypothetical protein
MTAQSEDSREAYDLVLTQKAALGHQLFELLVLDNWYGTLGVALKSRERLGGPRSPIVDRYHSEPAFDSPDDHPHYIGGSTLQEARKFKATALGEEVDDDRLKELVEELLKDELELYNIELRWMWRSSWDGSDRILCIYPKV